MRRRIGGIRGLSDVVVVGVDGGVLVWMIKCVIILYDNSNINNNSFLLMLNLVYFYVFLCIIRSFWR